jgi:hypothetical protein
VLRVSYGDDARDYNICILCGWEDDGQDDERWAGHWPPEGVAGGPNQDYSLSEARVNFERYMQKYRPSDVDRFERWKKAWPERERLVRAFQKLLPKAEPLDYIAALPKIIELFEKAREVKYPRS